MTEKWIVYGNPYIAAKELTVAPGCEVTVSDETPLTAASWHRATAPSTAAPARRPAPCALASAAPMSGLCPMRRPSAGVTVRNDSPCEPLVMLKHFPYYNGVPGVEE